MDFTHKGKHQVCFWKRSFIPSLNEWQTDMPRLSWDDFHLIPESRPKIEYPKANYSTIAIPGSSERFDITEYLPGGLTYQIVNGSWSFIVDHTQWENEKSWFKSRRALEKFFNGERFIVELTDEPGKLYSGRLWLSEQVSEDQHSTVKIEYEFGVTDFDIPDDLFFRIRFLDYTDEELQVDYMRYGEMPEYYRPYPTHKDRNFKAWDPEIEEVIGTTDYVATYSYKSNTYPIIFYDEDDNVIGQSVYVPDNMSFVFFDMDPQIRLYGKKDVLVENYWRVPETMWFDISDDPDTWFSYFILDYWPTKTDYVDGEGIDYTGMRGRAYNESGTYWKDDDHPNGIIQIDEIITDSTVARFTGGEDDEEIEQTVYVYFRYNAKLYKAYFKINVTYQIDQVQSDWSVENSTAINYIKNKPVIPGEQIQADWAQTDPTAKDYIKNKPNMPQMLPQVSSADNGKILRVVNGAWIADDIS